MGRLVSELFPIGPSAQARLRGRFPSVRFGSSVADTGQRGWGREPRKGKTEMRKRQAPAGPDRPRRRTLVNDRWRTRRIGALALVAALVGGASALGSNGASAAS